LESIGDFLSRLFRRVGWRSAISSSSAQSSPSPLQLLLEHYSPTLVATHTYVNPIVAVLFGWLFAGEAVTFNVLLSAALVIGAVMLVDRGMSASSRGPRVFGSEIAWQK